MGNPNCGKTSLFNSLTGSRQSVGNWPGVTVEKKQGLLSLPGLSSSALLVDLPGVYSLSPYSKEEEVTRDFLLWELPSFPPSRPQAVINLVDGTNLERSLYLTLQLAEMEIPFLLAVNLIDQLHQRGEEFCWEILSKQLGVPVLPVSAKTGEGIPELEAALSALLKSPSKPLPLSYDRRTENAFGQLALLLAPCKTGLPLRFSCAKLLEQDPALETLLSLSPAQKQGAERIRRQYGENGDSASSFANARYQRIQALLDAAAIRRADLSKQTVSDKIDRVLTHPLWAIPCFFLLIGLVFWTVFGPLGTALTHGFAAVLEGLGVLTARALEEYRISPWLSSLVLDAVVEGVGTVVSFLPRILLLFLFLSLLEDSGYMARAAFLMDKPLQKIGLSGRAFIPMLMGFGCTTPALLAVRTMERERDRRIAMAILPFISCSARLPIYILFAGVFFPRVQGFVVLGLYLLGVGTAAFWGFLLQKTIFSGDSPPFLLELPPYRLPTLSNTLRHLWEKSKSFLQKAGTVLFLMNLVVWLLQHVTPHFQPTLSGEGSLFQILGGKLAPLFQPLGFGTPQAALALLSGLMAKESILSTLAVLYGGELEQAVALAFTPLSACSFLIFTLLYMPCISAFLTLRKELGSWKEALSMALFQTGVAYATAWIFYRLGALFLGR